MSEKNSHHYAGERLKESLSVSLDGQASELELRRVLDGIGKDNDLRDTAGRYQLIGDALRGESSRFAGVDVSAGVMAAIEQEEVDSALKEASGSGKNFVEGAGDVVSVSSLERWWSSLGRVAMAASVAFAMVIGLRNVNAPHDEPVVAMNEPTTLSQPIQLNPGMQNNLGASGIRAGYNSRQHDSITPEQLAYAQSIADRATQERFRAYALQHAELSAINHGQGILSFARLTSFDAQ